MTVDPLAHERTQSPLGRGSERVEGEFVFTTRVDDPARDEETNPVEHSISVDPSDGREDELILDVTETHAREARGRRSFRVSVSPSHVGNPPRVQEVEATLKAWYHRHYNHTKAEGPSGVGRGT